MPRGDGTGPWGQGPMTGRGLGYCASNDNPGFAAPGPGMALGRGGRSGGGGGGGRGAGGRGASGGRGMRWGAPWACWPPVPTAVPAADEQTVLQQQRQYLQAQLALIEQQLSDLGGTETEQ